MDWSLSEVTTKMCAHKHQSTVFPIYFRITNTAYFYSKYQHKSMNELCNKHINKMLTGFILTPTFDLCDRFLSFDLDLDLWCDFLRLSTFSVLSTASAWEDHNIYHFIFLSIWTCK